MKQVIVGAAKISIVVGISLCSVCCNSTANKQNKNLDVSQSATQSTGEVQRDTTALLNEDAKKYFQVEKIVNNGTYIQSYVYLSDKSKLQDVNKYLVSSYKGKWTQVLDIWYFDKQGIVNKYLSVLEDENKSDDEFNKLDKHLICQYEQLAGQDGDFDYNN